MGTMSRLDTLLSIGLWSWSERGKLWQIPGLERLKVHGERRANVEPKHASANAQVEHDRVNVKPEHAELGHIF